MIISSIFIWKENKTVLNVGIYRITKSILPKNSINEMTVKLGVQLAKGKHYEAAKKLFEDALITNPKDAAILNNLGYILGEMGEISKAIEYLENAVKLSPNCAECLNNLGTLFYNQGKQKEAKEFFGKAIKVDSSLTDAALNLAVLAEEEGDWVTAMQLYKDSENKIAELELRKWVSQRATWLAEITKNSVRGIAEEK